jgi:hypothetical protein
MKTIAAKVRMLGMSVTLAMLIAADAASAQGYPSYEAASARSYRVAHRSL